MARVSSVMRTWPHPPTSSPAVKSREALLVAGCRDQRSSACVIVSPLFFSCIQSFSFFAPSLFFFFFNGMLLILATLHTSVPSPPNLLPSCHWRKIALLFRGLSSLVGLERTRNVWRRFSGWRLSASAHFWSETCSRWLRSWTLYGSVRCVNWFKTELTLHEKRWSTNWTETDYRKQNGLRVLGTILFLDVYWCFTKTSRHHFKFPLCWEAFTYKHPPELTL